MHEITSHLAIILQKANLEKTSCLNWSKEGCEEEGLIEAAPQPVSLSHPQERVVHSVMFSRHFNFAFLSLLSNFPGAGVAEGDLWLLNSRYFS